MDINFSRFKYSPLLIRGGLLLSESGDVQNIFWDFCALIQQISIWGLKGELIPLAEVDWSKLKQEATNSTKYTDWTYFYGKLGSISSHEIGLLGGLREFNTDIFYVLELNCADKLFRDKTEAEGEKVD